ncbi:hypothetical protein [Sedimentitalea nanhaiensis]|uniref:Uncharacterized protein n=1 Tax=Sedimentitalea nanhaiensis TaxID=999627 RepID=A0A1I7B3I0_9RHOB|nr:hypothetical protein [Sedimentitalea nanhaiensis]SFT81691.1 hypothetical protein SAMN05216236_108116 [Sedimentitalea nanhaiensis]
MANKKPDNPDRFPPLGRALLWVDGPGNVDKIVYALAGVCVVLFLADFTYKKHPYFTAEEIPGFYGIYGFVMFSALILVAKTLRFFIKRPENYYGDKAIDREEYPVDELDEVDYDA